jgi:hypothetical protein
MHSTADSMVALVADEETEYLARMATPWALMWRSDQVENHAVAMVWIGRGMNEMFRWIERAIQTDELGAQLKRNEAAPEHAEPPQH